MPDIVQNITTVKRRIAKAISATSRDQLDVRLLAVSKRQSIDAIKVAYRSGQREFGENYLQEATTKIGSLDNLDIRWHFIGAIQSNKTKLIAEHFNWVHTVDRLKIAKRLSEQRPNAMPPLNVCIQVNTDKEASKSGIGFDDILSLAEAIAPLPMLKLRGLMCIPKKDSREEIQTAFKNMQAAFDDIQSRGNFPHWDTLSMGMSSDLELAIANGANIVRIGTDIFGARE